MLARGKGFISMEELKNLFGLPEDSEIVRVNISDEGVEFVVVSAEPIEKKTHITEYPHSVRRFRIKEGVANIINNKFEIVTRVNEANADEIAKEIMHGLKQMQDKYNGND